MSKVFKLEELIGLENSIISGDKIDDFKLDLNKFLDNSSSSQKYMLTTINDMFIFNIDTGIDCELDDMEKLSKIRLFGDISKSVLFIRTFTGSDEISNYGLLRFSFRDNKLIWISKPLEDYVSSINSDVLVTQSGFESVFFRCICSDNRVLNLVNHSLANIDYGDDVRVYTLFSMDASDSSPKYSFVTVNIHGITMTFSLKTARDFNDFIDGFPNSGVFPALATRLRQIRDKTNFGFLGY